MGAKTQAARGVGKYCVAMRVLFCATIVMCAGCARDEGQGPRALPPCDVVREQAINVIQSGCLSFVFDEATGGPLTCTPGVAPTCDFVDDACRTAPIVLPVGTQATLAIGIRDACSSPIGVDVQSIVLVDADPAFVLLEPVPASFFFDEGFIFVGVTPAVEGQIAATVEVASDAQNQAAGVSRFGLIVDGTLP